MTKGTRYTPEFKASAPNRLHVADITYVRMADGRFGYTAFVTDAFARRIVGWACATTMNVFCQIFVGRFGVSFSPFERLFLGRFGFGQSCGLSVIA